MCHPSSYFSVENGAAVSLSQKHISARYSTGHINAEKGEDAMVAARPGPRGLHMPLLQPDYTSYLPSDAVWVFLGNPWEVGIDSPAI